MSRVRDVVGPQVEAILVVGPRLEIRHQLAVGRDLHATKHGAAEIRRREQAFEREWFSAQGGGHLRPQAARPASSAPDPHPLLHCRAISSGEFRDGQQSSLPVRQPRERARHSSGRMFDVAARRAHGAAAREAPVPRRGPRQRGRHLSRHSGAGSLPLVRRRQRARTRKTGSRPRTPWRSLSSSACRSAHGWASGSNNSGPMNASEFHAAKAASTSTCATTARRTRACCTWRIRSPLRRACSWIPMASVTTPRSRCRSGNRARTARCWPMRCRTAARTGTPGISGASAMVSTCP